MLNLEPISKESAYEKVKIRVDRFKAMPKRDRNALNEQDTRIKFILPLFEALGWDTTDPAQMRSEQNIKGKRVDFSFLINGKPRFLLETKAIGEDLNRAEFIKQARDYAWNKGVTWAVLSDFEGTRVFNAEWKEADPLAARVLDFTVENYLEKFEQLWLLSREAIAAGTLDSYAETNFKRTPRTPITESLFGQLIEARKKLYDDFRGFDRSLFNQERLVDDAVQRMLDRLIFLRTAEDRGVEHDTLRSIIRSAPAGKMSTVLAQQMHKLDAVYNSQLFASYPTDTFYSTDDTLRQVVEGLYLTPSKDAEYNFAAIDADVLGRVYEQYLGEVISEYAKSEVKKKKRKSQGIYYTPTFVVRYIVQQTLGRYLDERGYNLSKPVRVLDPACGSGSFLIEAFDVIDRYAAQQEGSAQDKHDTRAAMRQRSILEQNLYGVDKDEQAVEVARLNLMLKALYQREKLPMLKHIARGDSLVSGTEVELTKFFGVEWENKRAFNWAERFPEVMHEGGFDVIIGNPPYGATLDEPSEKYLLTAYKLQYAHLDTFVLFIERSLQLLKDGGVFGMIVPNTWLLNLQSDKIRRFLFENVKIKNIVHFRQPIFEAVVDTEILIFQKSKPQSLHQIRIAVVEKDESRLEYGIAQSRWQAAEGKPVNIFERPELVQLADSLRAHPKLDELTVITQGAKPFQVGKGKPPQTQSVVDEKPFVSQKKKNKTFMPLLRGSLIQRYDILWKNDYWISFGEWLAEPRYSANYNAPEKIVIRQTGDSLIATLDNEQFIVRDNLYTIVPRSEKLALQYVLGVLNSRLLNWFYQNIVNPEAGEALAQVKRGHLAQLPIRDPNLSNRAEKRQYDVIVSLVERMLKLHKDLQVANELDAERRSELQEQIERTDEQIDEVVFELYGLGAEEIALIRSSERH